MIKANLLLGLTLIDSSLQGQFSLPANLSPDPNTPGMSSSANRCRVFHLIQRSVWDEVKALQWYAPSCLQTEGFIHFCQREQILFVANTYYRDQDNLVLLDIDPSLLVADLRFEPPSPPNGAPINVLEGHAEPMELFPHLYGALNVEAVMAIYALPRNESGDFNLPCQV